MDTCAALGDGGAISCDDDGLFAKLHPPMAIAATIHPAVVTVMARDTLKFMPVDKLIIGLQVFLLRMKITPRN